MNCNSPISSETFEQLHKTAPLRHKGPSALWRRENRLWLGERHAHLGINFTDCLLKNVNPCSKPNLRQFNRNPRYLSILSPAPRIICCHRSYIMLRRTLTNTAVRRRALDWYVDTLLLPLRERGCLPRRSRSHNRTAIIAPRSYSPT